MIEPASVEVMERVRCEFGLNEQRFREATEHLKGWIQLQPYRPQVICTYDQDNEHD